MPHDHRSSAPNRARSEERARPGDTDRATGEDLARRIDHRATEEDLLRLARVLPASDRALVRSVLAHGVPALTLARAFDLQPWAVRRRLRRILARMTRPAFGFVAAEAVRWPEPRRSVARHRVLEGWSRRRTAEALGLTEHAVREVDRWVRITAAIWSADREDERRVASIRRLSGADDADRAGRRRAA